MSEDAIRLAQLLCSRLCHDLVGPAGAVNAGLELAKDGGLDPATLEMTERSAEEVTNRLAFFRVAFGAAGGKVSAEGTLSLHEARGLIESLLVSRKVALEWPNDAAGPDALPAGAGKVLLLLVLAAAECLPRGGGVSVHVAAVAEGMGLAIVAKGDGARLRPDVAQALAAADPDQVSARNVHGHYAAVLAASLGGRLEVSDAVADEVRLMSVFPPVGGAGP